MRWALLISFCFSTTTVFAQVKVLNDSLQFFDVGRGLPVKNKYKIIKPVSIALGYTAVGLFTYRYLDDEIQEIAQESQNEIAADVFKTIGYAGLGKTNIIITAGTGIFALASRNKKFEKAAILLVGAHLINSFVTEQLKITFQRHRPNTGDPYNTFDWRGGPKKNKSFVSFHTSNAFTTATVFAICFKDKKWVPIVAYSLASLVGLSRIYENAHWASDVLGGAAVGFLSAQAMNKLYNVLGKKFTFLTDVGYKRYGLYICYSF